VLQSFSLSEGATLIASREGGNRNGLTGGSIDCTGTSPGNPALTFHGIGVSQWSLAAATADVAGRCTRFNRVPRSGRNPEAGCTPYPRSVRPCFRVPGGWSQVACHRPDPYPAEAPGKSRRVPETAQRRPGLTTLIAAGATRNNPTADRLAAQRTTRRDRCAEQERGPDLVMRDAAWGYWRRFGKWKTG
jgi:hypothetical protein